MDHQRVILLGNASQDAQTKQSEKGEFVLLFVATKTRSGTTLFFPVFVAGKMAGFVKDIKKGAPLFVDGTLDASEYEPEGKEKKTELKIYADCIRRLGKKDDTAQAVKETLEAEEEKTE